jgi:hypothetical protein
VQRARFGPGGELRDEVNLAEELAHLLAGIFALAEHVQSAHDASESVFHLTDGDLRVVLALAFETTMVLEELLPKELRKTLAGSSAQRLGLSVDVRQTTLGVHLSRGIF